MAHRVSWAEPAVGKLRMNLARILHNLSVADERTRNEEALETILKEGKVEQTKAPPKFGMIP